MIFNSNNRSEMKKLFAIAVMVLALVSGASAQLQHRTWDKGPLTWQDFQVYPSNADSLNASWLQYSFKLTDTDTSLAGVKMERLRVVAYMEPKLSWVVEGRQSTTELHFNQVLFNLAELQARLFQSSFDRATDGVSYQDLMQSVADYCQADETRFMLESRDGADSLVVARWLDSTSRLLAEIPVCDMPRIKDAKSLGVGAHLGVMHTVHLGGLTKTFRNATSFEFGMEGLYGRSSYMFDFAIGGGGSKRHYQLDGVNFAKGTPYTWLQFWMGYGYYAVRQIRYSVMPLAGFGLSTITKGSDEESFSTACGSWIAGVAIDWNLSNEIYAPMYDGIRGQSLTGARLMLYASRSKLYDYNGVSMNVALLLNFGEHMVRFK